MSRVYRAIALIFVLMMSMGFGAEVIVFDPETWTPKVTDRAIVTADKMEYNFDVSSATLVGNVLIQHPQFTARADKIDIVFEESVNDMVGKKTKEKGKVQDNVRSAIAKGNVKAVGENVFLEGDRLLYFKDNGKLMLLGTDNKNPLVMKDGRSITGEVITMWLNDGKVEVTGKMALSMQVDPATSKSSKEK